MTAQRSLLLALALSKKRLDDFLAGKNSAKVGGATNGDQRKGGKKRKKKKKKYIVGTFGWPIIAAIATANNKKRK